MQYVVANELTTSGILTFSNARLGQLEEGSIEILHQFSLLIRSVRRKIGKDFPYTAVPEFSETGRPHIHFMLPAKFPYDIVEKKWSENGLALHQMIPNMEELHKVAFYLGKDFDKPEAERPTKRRVVNANGFKPKAQEAIIMTYAEAEQLAKQYAQAKGTTIKEIKSSKPWLQGGFTWLT